MAKFITLFLFLFIGSVAFADFSTTTDSIHHSYSLLSVDSSTLSSLHSITGNNSLAGPVMGAVFMFIIFLLCLALGIVAGAIALVLFLILAALGIISTSILIGLKKGSIHAAVKTFLLSGAGILGLVTGIILMMIVNSAFSLQYNHLFAALVGGTGGLLAGIVVGSLLYLAYKTTLARFQPILDVIKGK